MVQIGNASYDLAMAFKGNHRPIIAHIGYLNYPSWAPSAKSWPLIFLSLCQWQLVQNDLWAFGVHGNGSTMHDQQCMIPDNAYFPPHRWDCCYWCIFEFNPCYLLSICLSKLLFPLRVLINRVQLYQYFITKECNANEMNELALRALWLVSTTRQLIESTFNNIAYLPQLRTISSWF